MPEPQDTLQYDKILKYTQLILLLGTLLYAVGFQANVIETNTQNIEKVKEDMSTKLDYMQTRIDYLINLQIQQNKKVNGGQ